MATQDLQPGETCYLCGDSINTLNESYREKYIPLTPNASPFAAPAWPPPLPKDARVYAHERCAWPLADWGYAHKVRPRF